MLERNREVVRQEEERKGDGSERGLERGRERYRERGGRKNLGKNLGHRGVRDRWRGERGIGGLEKGREGDRNWRDIVLKGGGE